MTRIRIVWWAHGKVQGADSCQQASEWHILPARPFTRAECMFLRSRLLLAKALCTAEIMRNSPAHPTTHSAEAIRRRMSGLHAAMYDQRVCRQLAFPPHRRRHKAFALLMHLATKDEEPEGPLDR